MSNRIITRSFTLQIYISVILTLVLLIATPALTYGQYNTRAFNEHKSPRVTGPSRSINNQETPPATTHLRRPDSIPLGQIVEHNETSITFVACMKSPEQTRMTDSRRRRTNLNHVAQLSPKFQRGRQTLLQGSKTLKSILPSERFVRSVDAAYKDYHNVLLAVTTFGLQFFSNILLT